MTDLRNAPIADMVFRGTGPMATRMRAFDWSATPLGPVDAWPASLRTTVSTLLSSRHAMFLWWGPDLIQFYNDAYRGSLGPDRHPSALGDRGRVCWAEIWPIIGPEIESIMVGGAATWHEDHLVPITRGDRVHDVYWSYSYSPVQDDDGRVGGVLVTVQETTRRVVSERRIRLLQQLGTALQRAVTAEEVATRAASALALAPHDVACALVYLMASDGTLHLAGVHGLDRGGPHAPLQIPAGADAPWPVSQALQLDPLSAALAIPSAPPGPIMCDIWPEPVRDTLTLPLPSEAGAPHGVVILGLNPRLPLDEPHVDFATQISRELGGALDRVNRVARERDAARAAAAAERELLTRVFELSPSFLAVLRGPSHTFELINPAYQQLIGHREVLGRSVRDALPEVAGQRFFELLDEVYETGSPFVGNEVRAELQVEPHAALEERYLNFVYQAVRDAAGRIDGILATGVDVTALVRARQAVERALRDTEVLAAERDLERRQLLTVLEQAPLATAVVAAPSGRVAFTNRMVLEIFGHSRHPRSVAEYADHWRAFRPDGSPVAASEWPVARALLHGESVHDELVEVERADGRRVDIMLSAAPVRNEEGETIAAIAFFRDVTEERRTERELRNAQRIQAVGTLAGGVAHEINNQMTAVIGFGEFVLAALGPEHEQAADLRLVLQAGHRAARVSQQLLAFTRQQVTQPRLVDLLEIVTDLKPVLLQLLGSDKQLLVSGVANGPPVNADPDQVQQVLINLVANARDATQTGADIRIHVDETMVDRETSAPLGEKVAPGRYVRVSVSDSGIGMAEETLLRIFEPFFTLKAVGKGTGLGLPMVYGTMRRHDGYVLPRSELGRGTTFDLLWPVAAEAPAATERGGPGRGDRRGGPDRGIEVMVVEDEAVVRALARRILEHDGYRVKEASSGAEALAMLDAGAARPDVVATDMIMPQMNGRQLHDILQQRMPEVRVLFMSGHTGEGDVLERLMPRGAPFLQKPFTPHALVAAVAALAPRRQ